MTQRRFHSLTQAVEVYYDELRRFVQRRTGSLDLAEEVVQETWLRAHATDVALPANPRAYLYRMAGNLAIDQIRRAASGTGRLWVEAEFDAVASPGPAPDAIVAARQEIAILSVAIEELPERCRTVFLLYRGQGLTMREIGQRLGISQKTVEKHIARAMVHCRARLQAAGREV